MSRDWKNLFPSRRMIFLSGGGVVFLGLTARLAELQLFLAWPVATHLGRGRVDAQVLEGQFVPLAVVESDLEHARASSQPDVGGARVGHVCAPVVVGFACI